MNVVKIDDKMEWLVCLDHREVRIVTYLETLKGSRGKLQSYAKMVLGNSQFPSNLSILILS